MTGVAGIPELAGKTVLVTGATGFIGGRLVERLCTEVGARVHVLLRNYISAFRIARCPIQMHWGDLLEAEDVARAAEGCEVIVHCAYATSGDHETQRRVNVEGTRQVLEAARAIGARVVHLSTLQVYGALGDGRLDETAPRRYSQYATDVYSSSKLDAENLAVEYYERHALPVSIIQPTIVYGPFGSVWTTMMLEWLKTSRVILVNGGSGYCNAVYVDDVVTAILLAAARDAAVGEAFLVSAARPVTWRDFFGAFEAMLGEKSTVEMTVEEADATMTRPRPRLRHLIPEMVSILRENKPLRRRLMATVEASFFYGVLDRMLSKETMTAFKQRTVGRPKPTPSDVSVRKPEKPIRPLFNPLNGRFYAARPEVSIDKARRLLGYEPQFDFARGMAVTEEWCRWANLLEPHPSA